MSDERCETCGCEIGWFDHRGTRGMSGKNGCRTCHYAYKALRACGDEADDIAAWVSAIAKKAAADALDDMRTEMRGGGEW